MARPKIIVTLPTIKERILGVVLGGSEMMLQNRLTEIERRKIKGEKKPGYKEDHSQKEKRWKETAHWGPRGIIGFPTEAFLKAMSVVLKSVDLSKKKLFKGKADLFRALTIDSDFFDQDGIGCIRFLKGKVECVAHWALLRGQIPIPIYRAGVNNWETELRITYDETWLTHDDVLLLLSAAGRRIGIGAWRVEKGGTFGRFNIRRAAFLGGKKAA